MSKKVWLFLIPSLLILCVLSTACLTLAYVGYRNARTGTQTGVSGSERAPDGDTRPIPSGGVLRLAGSFPPTLDPAMVQDSTSAEYVVHLFSGLVSLNSKLEIVPDLAKSWELSQDGRTYTFQLQPGVSFQDGRSITAADVVYSIERALSPRTASPVAESYLGDIVGAAEFAAGRAEHIQGLQAEAERSVRIEIDAPKAYFLAKLTYPAAFVVDRAQIEKEGQDWVRKPNGSGPFGLQSMDRERIVLVRNERYYGQRAALERVEYNLGEGQPITMYENGQLDIVEVPPSEIERILDPDNALHAEYHVAPELSVHYLGLDVTRPPFDDVAVRQAFTQAIDKQKIADLVMKGTASPAVGILPPALPDYNPTLEGLPYDPAQARKLLANSRYGAAGQMPKIVLAVSGTSGHMSSETRALLSMIQETLSISMTVEQVEWSDFLRDLNEHRYQAFVSGWVGDYPDSQNFLDLLFHEASSQNHSGYRNAQVDKLLEQARVESDPARRTALYRQAERIIVNEAPWIPLTHGTAYTLVKPYVKGFQTSAAIFPWIKEIYFQK